MTSENLDYTGCELLFYYFIIILYHMIIITLNYYKRMFYTKLGTGLPQLYTISWQSVTNLHLVNLCPISINTSKSNLLTPSDGYVYGVG